MKKYIYFKLIGLALLIVSMAACDTADQEVSPVVSPDGYPVATYTLSSPSTSIVEGDTLIYIITTDKPIDRSITFSAEALSGTAGAEDYIIIPTVLEPYTTEVKLYVVTVRDNMPEVTETLQLKIGGSFSIADRYLLNSRTVPVTVDMNIVNYNDPDVLTIAFGWPNPDDDIDCYALSGINKWGSAATSANPEILTAIWPSDPNGTYYFGIDPYLVNEPILDYTISIGYPDQTVQFITGAFDTANLGSYTLDHYGTAPIYRLLTIVNLDGVFTITNLNK